MDDKAIIQRLDRIERKLSMMIPEKKKTWVKISFVTALTGWDNNKMRQAREQGLVEWKDDKEHGRMYNVDSINPIFFKTTTVTT